MSLADKWGYANPDAMLASMTSRNLTEWRHYFQLEAEAAESERESARLLSEIERG